MATIFTDENVEAIIAEGKPVVVDFWATWCGPCMNMAPIIDELAEEYKDKVIIGKYNAEEENDFASSQRVMALPTIIFFKDGEKKMRLAGSQTKEALQAKIEELINI